MKGKKAVITGIGIVSSLGTGIQKVSTGLRAGKSGIVIDQVRREYGFRSALTGVISDLDPLNYLDRKQRKTMPEYGIWAYAAIEEAIENSDLPRDNLKSNMAGIIFGNDSSALTAVEQVDIVRREKATRPIGSGHVFRLLNSTLTINLNTILGTRGANWTLSGACASGGHSVGQAAMLISQGTQDIVICGGAQEINWESMCSFDAIGAFSKNEDNPCEASRPFDKNRDGLVPSGGAAAIILESEEHAVKRNANIIGEVAGYGFSSDGYHISMPDKNGLTASMTMALNNADMEALTVDYICAHATSTPLGDATEASAICDVFKEKMPWVSSIKSMTGHEMWMSGASQVVYSLLMNQDGFIAGNINFISPDKNTDLLRIPPKTIMFKPKNILCNSAGFGGTNSSLCIKGYA